MQLCEAIKNENISLVKKIICYDRMDPNILLPEGLTPLHLAAGISSSVGTEMVQLLLEYGANPNLRSADGLTAVSVSAAWGCISTLKVLLRNGGNSQIVDNEGNDAWRLAEESEQYEALKVLRNYNIHTHVDDSATSLPDHSNFIKQEDLIHFDDFSSTFPSCSTDASDPFNDATLCSEGASSISRSLCDVIEYGHQDDNDKVTLIEEHWLPQQNITPDETLQTSTLLGGSTKAIYDWKSYTNSVYEPEITSALMGMHSISDDELRRRLLQMGYSPGPILPSTRGIYSSLLRRALSRHEDSYRSKLSYNEFKDLSDSQIFKKVKSLGDCPGPVTTNRLAYTQKLKKLLRLPPFPSLPPSKPVYSRALHGVLTQYTDVQSFKDLETKISNEFRNHWLTTEKKNSFNYLLLDPRVTGNLPLRASDLTSQSQFQLFIGAIFYIGKGKQDRPLDHMKKATQQLKAPQNPCRKVKRIMDIWASDAGVVLVHCFLTIGDSEARTREASMIDAIGLTNLTNLDRGSYHGISRQWKREDQCKLGTYLLHKAMEMYIADGEHQVRPNDI